MKKKQCEMFFFFWVVDRIKFLISKGFGNKWKINLNRNEKIRHSDNLLITYCFSFFFFLMTALSEIVPNEVVDQR